jgi:hypothetical protein
VGSILKHVIDVKVELVFGCVFALGHVPSFFVEPGI